jgi:hypothetical protein
MAHNQQKQFIKITKQKFPDAFNNKKNLIMISLTKYNYEYILNFY